MYTLVISASHFLMPKSTESKKCFLKTCQKSEAMDCKDLESKLTNWHRLISKTNSKCQLHNILRSIYQKIPEMADIPDKYATLYWFLCFHSCTWTGLSQKINKMTRCYYAMKMLLTCSHGRQNKSVFYVSEKKKTWLMKYQPAQSAQQK